MEKQILSLLLLFQTIWMKQTICLFHPRPKIILFIHSLTSHYSQSILFYFIAQVKDKQIGYLQSDGPANGRPVYESADGVRYFCSDSGTKIKL